MENFPAIILAAGILILLFSLIPIRSIFKSVNERLPHNLWYIILALVFTFICAYIIILIGFIIHVKLKNIYLVTSVFFFGALYVYISSKISKKTIVDLVAAKKYAADLKAEKNEMKARFNNLFENSVDIILVLDNKGVILASNRAIKSHLKYPPEKIINKKLIDLIYEDDSLRLMNKRLFSLAFNGLLKNKSPQRLSLSFIQNISMEPKDMQIQLEYIKNQDNYEIIAKIKDITDDILKASFISEKQSYSIDNSLTMAEYIATRITSNLIGFMNHDESNRIRIALREILLNSIEHGNLEISSEEKTNALLNDSYFDLISERQNSEKYKNRKVTIDHFISKDGAEFTITDQGKGFDFNKYIASANDGEENSRPNGRGITMSLSEFDSVTYDKNGCRVKLIKKFNTVN